MGWTGWTDVKYDFVCVCAGYWVAVSGVWGLDGVTGRCMMLDSVGCWRDGEWRGEDVN